MGYVRPVICEAVRESDDSWYVVEAYSNITDGRFTKAADINTAKDDFEKKYHCRTSLINLWRSDAEYKRMITTTNQENKNEQ